MGLKRLLAFASLRRLSLNLGVHKTVTPDCVQLIEAHPVTRYLQYYDWDREVFERITLQDDEHRRDWD